MLDWQFYWIATLMREERLGGGLGEVQNASWKNAKVECAGCGDKEGDSDRGRDGRRCVVPGWRLEIHGDDHAQIIVGADDAIDRRDDDQQHERPAR